MVRIPRTRGVGTPQQHTTHPEIESLFKPKLRRTATVGRRPLRDASDVLFHTVDRLRVVEVRDQEVTPHLHDFLLAE